MSKQRIFIYNPSEKPKNQLIAEFVIRKDIFKKIFKDIKDAASETPAQHYLIAGQRGMGKTTLLLRIQYAIEDDSTLSKYLIPIRFSEEQYNIGRLERLWEETALMLEHKAPDYADLYEEMLKHEDKDEYERTCFEILANKLKARKQRVLLMIDNIGDLFDRFPEIQNHRLREVLMTCPNIQIIGSSSRVLEHTFHYDKPFFEFFHEVKLNPITKQNSIDLLRALGEANGQIDKIDEIIKNTPERIEVLRRITGGVPRTTVLLYEIFVDHNNGNAFEDLQLLLDGVNSLYKHRMDELKPQQQQIIDALARAWEPISAAEVLEQSKLYRDGLQSNQISAQLKQLADNQVVEMVEGVGRKKTYRIRERFFNIWYLMRHGRKQSREEVLWLVKFLAAWCSQKELNEMVNKQIECMRTGYYSENAAYYKALALSDIEGVEEYQKVTLISETAKFLKSKNRPDRVINLEKLIDSKESSTLVNSAIKYIEKKDYDQAESLLIKAEEKGDESSSYLLGLLYTVTDDLGKAKINLIKAVDKGNKDAISHLALLYDVTKDFNKAINYYTKAIEIGDVDSMYNLALLYDEEMKDFEKAELYYLMALEHGDVKSLNNIAILYENVRKDYLKAEMFFLKAIEHGDVKSLNNIGLLYFNVYKDYEKAEKYLLMALKINPKSFKNIFNLILINSDKNDTKSMLGWSERLFEIEGFFEHTEKVLDIVDLLIEKKQYHFLLNQFQKENSLLMKHAKPYYYALAYFLKEELPGEYEKAGAEIKETVDEIIHKHERIETTNKKRRK